MKKKIHDYLWDMYNEDNFLQFDNRNHLVKNIHTVFDISLVKVEEILSTFDDYMIYCMTKENPCP